jgi:hypothetical protein
MLKILSSTGLFFLLAIGVSAFNYSISTDGSTAYINDSNAYVGASPIDVHPINGVAEVIVTIKNYRVTAPLTIGFLFNKSYLKPLELDFIDQYNYTVPNNYTCPYVFNTTTNYFWCITNSTTIVYEHGYTTKNTTTKTAYWNDTYQNYWSNTNYTLQKTSYTYDNKDTIYYLTGATVPTNTTYTYRILLQTPILRLSQKQTDTYPDYNGEYGLFFMPTSYGTNWQQAQTDNKFDYVDPSVNLSFNLTYAWNWENTLNDEKASSNLGNCTNYTFTTANNKIGNYSLNMTKWSAYCGTSPQMSNNINFSFCTWLYWNGTAQSVNNYFGMYNGGSFTTGSGVLQNGTLQYDANNGTDALIRGPIVTNNTWFHTCFAMNSTIFKAYYNGALIQSKTGVVIPSFSCTNLTCRIGADDSRDTPTLYHFNGYMDQTLLFKGYVVDDADVSSIYANWSGPIYPYDSCQYINNGNWNIKLNDKCVITTTNTVSPNKLNITGIGTFTIGNGGNVITKTPINSMNATSILPGGKLAILP